MLIAGLLLFSSSLLNVKPSPVFADVSVGTEGPYRFLVDTGNQTSLIDPILAAQLNLKPEFRVDPPHGRTEPRWHEPLSNHGTSLRIYEASCRHRLTSRDTSFT